jgi:hypothetical protein
MTVAVADLFCGYLLLTNYKTPANQLNAAVSMNTRKQFRLEDPDDCIGANLKAFERAGTAAEQSLPVSLPDFKAWAPHVRTLRDMDFFLGVLGSWFTLSRPQAFLSLKWDKITFPAGKAKVIFTEQKGKNQVKHTVEMEEIATSLKTPKLKFDNYKGALKTLSFCPRAVFVALKSRSPDAVHVSNFGAGDAGYQKFRDASIVFLKASGYQGKAEKDDPDKERFGYTLYMSRVGGVCTLLKSGLDPAVVKAVANWSSDMIERYGAKVNLEPSCVEACKFYNPVGHKNRYTAHAEPSAKRQKKK